jgi:hypothetical protein
MEILKTKYSENKAATLFNMMHSNSRGALKDYDGDQMEIENYVIYTDTDQNGEIMTCVTLREPDGSMWTTNGATFVRDFQMIVEACEVCGEELDAIKIIDGKSNKGRTYRTCEMVE